MRWRPLLVALSVAGITGCAAVAHSRGISPRDQLAHAAAALDAQNYGRARELLEPLYYQHWRESVGQQAMLMLIAAELDGRNPERRLWAAADMASRLLQIPQLEPWVIPVAESYYVLAVELGATEERVALAEAARVDAEERAERAEQRADREEQRADREERRAQREQQAERAVRAERATAPPRKLPTPTRETVPAQLRRLNRDREELKRQIAQLESQVSERDRELRETKQELERIKKTIKP